MIAKELANNSCKERSATYQIWNEMVTCLKYIGYILLLVAGCQEAADYEAENVR